MNTVAEILVPTEFKKTDLGLLPVDWVIRQVNDVCTLVNGRGFKPYEWRDRGVPIIRIQNLNGSDEFNYFDEAYNRKIEIKPGQLLFAWSGSRGTSFGPHIWAGPVGLLNYHTWKVIVDENKVSSDFFFHVLKGLTEYIEDQAHGASALVHVQKGQMEVFQLALPPTVAEQSAIATALSDADGLIEALERLIAKKRAVKQGAMQELLSGRTRLPGFSGDWCNMSLIELAANKKILFDDGDWIEAKHLADEGVRFIQTGNIGVGCFLDKADKKFVRPTSITALGCKFIRPGDLLICRLADPVGRACVLPDIGENSMVTSVDITIFRPPAENTDRRYLQQVFSTDEWFALVAEHSGGTTHKRIARGALGKLTIQMPKVEEQKAIADVLEALDEVLGALEARLAKARAIKQGMMQELLTGRVRLV
ncbi:restriction endonuclease subunit S [Oecophyllibacter saccharovorans]|uniref:restriction endonuclease subunit S n=1 Tax=Oecophyllibacter saccharovorans TaxID=2558360 RepID=UPI0018843A85|nr:restriction endonuclease subunit S [Oecophyllibacter saccharovorans]